MAVARGSFKNISFKQLDSDAYNQFQNPDGEIRFSNLFFTQGATSNNYVDSDVFTNSSTPIFTARPPQTNPGAIGTVLLSALVGGAGPTELYLKGISPDGLTLLGDVDSSGGNIANADALDMLQFAGADADQSITNGHQNHFGYWCGKEGAAQYPFFPSDGLKMSMFKGSDRFYAKLITATAVANDADGFGFRVKLADTNAGIFLYISNPYYDAAKGKVEIYQILSDSSITYVDTVVGPSYGSYFGYSLDADGDYFIVGAPFYTSNDGRAYVYDRLGTLTATFTAPTSNVFFGSVVAINSRLDRVAIGDQTIQNQNDATYGYQIGKVELSTFKSATTQLAYFDNPSREAISFSTSTNNTWYFGCNAFKDTNDTYDDNGTMNTFSADALRSQPPQSGLSSERGMQTIAFGGEYLYVGAPGGYTLTSKGKVHRFNASDGSYVSSATGAGTTGGSYGSALDADSDGVLVGGQLFSLYGGQVHLESLTLSEQDALTFTGMNSLQDWGFDDTTNAAHFGQYVAKSKNHLAVRAEGTLNGPRVSDSWIGIFPASGSTSFNSIFKAFTNTAFENSNGLISGISGKIGDLDIIHSSFNNRSYLVVGLPTTTISGETYEGGVLVYDIDDAIQDITVTGEAPTA